VRRTNRLVVAHEAVVHGGFGAEVVAAVQEAAFDDLDAPIGRVGAPFAPIPVSPPLEDAYLPGRQQVFDAVRRLGVGSPIVRLPYIGAGLTSA
jgi:pyruvate dehydrogenase E1 component beta subunit